MDPGNPGNPGLFRYLFGPIRYLFGPFRCIFGPFRLSFRFFSVFNAIPVGLSRCSLVYLWLLEFEVYISITKLTSREINYFIILSERQIK